MPTFKNKGQNYFSLECSLSLFTVFFSVSAAKATSYNNESELLRLRSCVRISVSRDDGLILLHCSYLTNKELEEL